MKIATLFFCIIPLLAGCEKLDINKNCLNSLSSCFKQDKTAPSISGSQALPNSGSTSVSLLTAIQVTFSEELKDMTNLDRYNLSGQGAAELAKDSVDKIGPRTIQLNLKGTVNNGAILLTFPGLTDYGGNALIAGSNVSLTGNVNIGIKFDDASTTYYVSSAGTGATRVLSAVIHWHHTYDKNGNNNYTIKIGGSNCDDAPTTVSGPTGPLAANAPVTTTITVASQFSVAGTYAVRVCIKNPDMNKSGDDAVTVISDDTPPTVSADIGAGGYGTAQTVNFSCGDNCDRIAYTLASGNPAGTPADPVFTSGGATANSLMTAAWQTPHFSDPWINNIKLLAYDKAGNQSGVISLSYKIDVNIPTISFGSPAVTKPYVSPSGYTSTTINWSADKAGNYLICRGGTGCSTTPTCTGGTAIGTAQPYPPVSQPIGTQIATTIANGSLTAGTNTIHICLSTGIQVGDATRTVTLDNTAPTLAALAPLDGAISILPSTAITVNFTEAVGLDVSTISTTTADENCAGTIQLSDNFISGKCIQMDTTIEQLSPTSFRFKSARRLSPGTYKIRVTNGVKDLAGNSYAGITQTTGFVVIGLLRQFTFNDDAGNLVDQALSGKDLGVNGILQKTVGVDGDVNGSYRFDGNSTNYLMGSDTQLPTGNSPRTICTWVKMQRCLDSTGLCMAIMYGADSGGHGPYLGSSGTKTGFGAFGGGDDIGATFFPLHTWTHMCSVYTGSATIGYLNGIQDGGTSHTWTTNLSGELVIGRQSGSASSYVFTGSVDDVRIYAGALTKEDIRQFAIQVPNGLMAYFPFSDASSLTATDYSGNGHTGNRNGGPSATTDRFNTPGSGAYNFSSSTQTITATGAGLPAGNAPRTVCAWLKPTALPSSFGFAIGAMYGSPATSQGNYIGFYNDGTTMNAIYSGWSDHVTAPFTPEVGAWTHICGTYDGTTAQLHVNGAILTSAAKSWNTLPVATNGGIYIGNGDATQAYPFTGAVDDVRIYNRVLTAGEINVLSDQIGVGMVRQFSFTNGSRRDETGWGGTLTAAGSPPQTSRPQDLAASAVSFNGTTQYLTGPDTGLPMGGVARTMCAWVNTPGSALGSFIASYGSVNNSQNSFLANSNFTDAIFGSFSTNFTAAGVITNNTWQYVCGVLNSAGIAAVYVNGVIPPGATPATTAFNTISNGVFAVGARSDSNTASLWSGSIDEVRVYNRALTAAEIVRLQNY